ncbi:DUF4397 domain-containing protein [Lacibacter sp. H407]|uniref:DUF4397 domain-containing protein n=1 Tax=Lacibacter sp. H407 TaxID=3133423 RepID=UPI0030C12A73
MNKLLLCIVLMIIFASCKKDQVPGTTTDVLLINASPNSGALELLQNQRSIGQLNYVTGLQPTVSYTTLDSGFNNYKLKKGTAELASWLFTNTGRKLSFFVSDSTAQSSLKYFFLTDNLDTVGLGKRSKIRLVHLSPDADTVDIVTTRPINPAEDSVVMASKIYAGTYNQSEILSTAAFQNFYADSIVYVKIRKRSNNNIVKLYQFNFEKGGVYSLLLKGYLARGGADSLSLSIIRHN